MSSSSEPVPGRTMTDEEIEAILTKISEAEIVEARKKLLYSDSHQVMFEGVAGTPYVRDLGGKTYLDCTAQAWSLNVGFSHPDVVAAIHEQSKRLTHVRSHVDTVPKLKLAQKVCELAPGKLKKITFNCEGGSMAIECAVKLAMINRKGADAFVTLWDSYHGSTLGTMASSWRIPSIRFPFFGADHFVKAPHPYCYRCPLGLEYTSCGIACAEFLEKTINKGTSSKVAGVIVEPIMGNAGQIPCPPEYLKEVRKICDQSGALLIFDELQTGFGRLGKWFAAQYYNVEPDYIAFGKALGGGVPIGGTLANEELEGFAYWEDHSTFQFSPLLLAASLVNLHVIEKLRLLERAESAGRYVKTKLEKMKEKYDLIGDVRGVGLFLGVELVRDRKTKEPAIKEAESVVSHALKNGVILALSKAPNLGNVIKIKPPLIMTDEQLDLMLDVLEAGIRQISLR